MLALLLPLLAIDINIDPVMGEFGPFTLTWHGFFTAVGIVAGVSLSVWLAKKDGIPTEIGQEIALVGVPCAIVGARLFYVAEHWDRFSGDPAEIITGITEGGITLYGGLLGGVIGGVLYALYHKWPIGIGLDAAAPGLILGQGIGRIGDLINGEHHADESGLPWAVRYTHPETLGELGVAVHPTAGGYEMLGDFIICGLLVFVVRRYARVPGWVFCSYMVMYGVMRFFLSYTRTDEQVFYDVPVPQIVSGILIGAGLALAAVFYRWPGPITPEYAERAWGDLPPPEPEPEGDDAGNGPAEAAPARG
jgi:phosphatidylglycerol:prolipoprotein diacylglycerol transferase